MAGLEALRVWNFYGGAYELFDYLPDPLDGSILNREPVEGFETRQHLEDVYRLVLLSADSS